MNQINDITKPLQTGDYTYDADGVPIQFRYKEGRIKALVISFHGALNRETRELPFFQAFLPIDVCQIAISDPTLNASDAVTMGWYLGADGWDLPAKLSQMIRQIGQTLGASRRIYVGASSGGFAALLYSSMDESSVVVAANPQTHLAHYQNASFDTFMRDCWPSCETIDDLGQLMPLSMCDVYSKVVRNRVIYIQSSGDLNHVKNHYIPFSAALNESNLASFLPQVDYWGIPGHSGSVPPRAWVPWVRAALTAKSLKTADILDTRKSIEDQAARSDAPAKDAPAKKGAFDAADIAMADKVRDHLLGLS